jgi:uncharacterized membrane protein
MATATMEQEQATREQEQQRGGSLIEGGHSRQRYVNVNNTERMISALGGGALALYGLTRGTLGGVALAIGGGVLIQRGLSGHCMGYQALGINTADEHGPASSVAAGHGVKVEKAVTINAPREKLYQFWRKLENLPRIMGHLKAVKDTGGKTSHWEAQGPLNTTIEWDAEIINEKENELIAWKSLEGSTVDNAGSVHFTPAPGDRGTEVRVILKYDPPAGKVGSFIAKLFRRAPEQEIKDDLARFKQLMETGEIATVEGQVTCC